MGETRQVTLYTRYGCHLCDDMLLLLNEYAEELHFEVMSVDVDDNPVLQSRYNDAVPVLMVDNREVCRHFFNLSALREALTPSDSR